MTGLEMLPIAEGAIKGLATIVGSTAGKAGIQALGKTGNKLSLEVQKLLFQISKDDIQNYMERHGILKVLGMREPVSLESVYTTVRVLDNDTIRGFLSVEALEKKFRQTDKRGFASKEPSKSSGLTVANETQYLMVLGGPGMGKGILRQADDVLIQMEQEAQTCVAASKLQRLLEWADRITEGSAGEIEPVGKRALALALANANANGNANVYANAYANANVYANAYANANADANTLANANANADALDRFITYARKLSDLQVFNTNFTVLLARLKVLKARIPDDNKQRREHQAFAQRIVQTWREAFDLSSELIDLSQEEIKAIENYLKEYGRLKAPVF